MDNFLNNLSQVIQDTVIASLSTKIQQFSEAVSAESDGKLTPSQVMDVWNKMHPSIVINAHPTPSTPPTPPTKSSPTPRTKTDKTRKCAVLKTAGKEIGQPCGKNCVIGGDACVSHTKKTDVVAPVSAPVATVAPVVVKPVASPPAEGVIGTDEQLTAMKVDELKNLLRMKKINFGSREVKSVLIGHLVNARDAAVAPVVAVVAPCVAPCVNSTHDDDDVVHEAVDEFVEEV
jgi:hypothetical protein